MVGITIICLICLLFMNIKIDSVSHSYLAFGANTIYCMVTKLFDMGDLTVLGGCLWLTYYGYYHNSNTSNSSVFSIYELTFVARLHL